MANGRGWGQDATLAPGWERVGQAAWNAVAAPQTWGPAAGALAFRIGHADRNAEEWAVRRNPVFGNPENASRMSDSLLEASGAIWGVSAVSAPSGETAADWAVAKAGGLGVQTGAGILTRGVVGYLKDNAGRPKREGNDESPSGHATGAALFGTFASRNIDTLGWSQDAVAASRFGLGAITAATAWARVEAGFHYPSDVLAGIALGHFVGAFATDAFLGLDNPRNAVLLLEPSRQGAAAIVRIGF
jgi:membrane-associated phospholipid phosphatase